MKLKEIPLSIYFELRLKLLNTEKLKTTKQDQLPVIVSLTSIPSRLKKVHITIKSVLDQVQKPKKIILWLNEADKNHVPKSLTKLEGDIFNIKYTPLTCSHKKLIHTLELYPEAIIVTCDDDFIYDKKWLENLYDSYLLHPKNIIANQIRQIQYYNNKLLSYKYWNLKDPEQNKTILAIGAGGILYPPNALSPLASDSQLFLKLAPKADDLWFKAMALLQGTTVIQTKNPPKRLIPIMGTQMISLKKENVDQNKNVSQWEALTEYFNLELP
jgi:hypothetical protein